MLRGKADTCPDESGILPLNYSCTQDAFSIYGPGENVNPVAQLALCALPQRKVPWRVANGSQYNTSSPTSDIRPLT
jgi:hypothetical protein